MANCEKADENKNKQQPELQPKVRVHSKERVETDWTLIAGFMAKVAERTGYKVADYDIYVRELDGEFAIHFDFLVRLEN